MPKIVINISDDTYRKIHMGKSIDPYYLGNAIKNGVILLDEKKKYLSIIEDIKAEIQAIEMEGRVDERTRFIRGGEEVRNLVLKIIDKHTSGKE